jgi:hypothetical protein
VGLSGLAKYPSGKVSGLTSVLGFNSQFFAVEAVALILIWLAWTCHAYSRRIRTMAAWESTYSQRPWRESTWFVRVENSGSGEVAELLDENFHRQFTQFGLQLDQLFQFLVAGLLVSYFAILQILST